MTWETLAGPGDYEVRTTSQPVTKTGCLASLPTMISTDPLAFKASLACLISHSKAALRLAIGRQTHPCLPRPRALVCRPL